MGWMARGTRAAGLKLHSLVPSGLQAAPARACTQWLRDTRGCHPVTETRCLATLVKVAQHLHGKDAQTVIELRALVAESSQHAQNSAPWPTWTRSGPHGQTFLPWSMHCAKSGANANRKTGRSARPPPPSVPGGCTEPPEIYDLRLFQLDPRPPAYGKGVGGRADIDQG